MAALVLLASGCANRPESISASYVSHEKYGSLSCTELSTALADARYRLSEFSGKQNTKANADAGTVFFALVPLSALTGDFEGDVAKWKGEVEAIETAQVIQKCKSVYR
jgi:hypothetical protein